MTAENMTNITNKTYKGNLCILTENQAEWEAGLVEVECITGKLSNIFNASLPSLKNVMGKMVVFSNAYYPALKSIGGDLYINFNAFLNAPALTDVRGVLYIFSKASLYAPALRNVGSDLYIFSEIDRDVARQLWEANAKNRWHLSDRTSEFLLRQQGNIEYGITDSSGYRVPFESKDLFDKVRHGEITIAEVLAIENMEQRRVAYERMNKAKSFGAER